MSITRGVLALSPEPWACDKMLDNNPEQIRIWKCWIFEERGKPEYQEKNLSEQGQEPTIIIIVIKTQPISDAESGNRTRATLVGGKCSHNCAIPASHFKQH